MIRIKITDPVFKTEPLFILNCSYNELRNYLVKQFNCDVSEESDNHGEILGKMITYSVAPHRIVYIKDFNFKTEDWGIVSHEIFHLVTRICQDKGVPILSHIENGECGDEAAAYLFEFFFSEFMTKIKKIKK